jgi:adenylate cyclase
VGNFGGSSVFDYRALGDPVNTAARLESANKQLGTWVCVSADTLAGCPDWPVRPIGHVLLQGKTIPLMVYELLDPVRMAGGDPAFQAAFEALSIDPGASLAAFTRLAAQRADDALVALHVARLQAGHRNDLIVLTQK